MQLICVQIEPKTNEKPNTNTLTLFFMLLKIQACFPELSGIWITVIFPLLWLLIPMAFSQWHTSGPSAA